MATARQIAANRRNAQKSTGPRTAAGKARSSRNALRYGPVPTIRELDRPRIDSIVQALVGETGARPEDAALFAEAHIVVERMVLHDKALLQRMLAPRGSSKIIHASGLAPFYLREQRARRRRMRALRRMVEGAGTGREQR